MRSNMLAKATVSEEDFNYITMTDDVDEVVDIMVKHRTWKESQIAKAQQTS